MPEWHPDRPGEYVDVPIIDLLAVAEGSWRSESGAVPDLAAELHRADTALTARLLDCAQLDRRAFQNLASLIPLVHGSMGELQKHLKASQAYLAGIRDSRDFRPLSADPCVTRLACSVFNGCTPPELGKVGRRLTEAVLCGIEQQVVFPRSSQVGMLVRGTEPATAPAEEFGRGLLVTMHLAVQAFNLAAHPGDYPPMPLRFIGSQSADLREGLRLASEFLENLARQAGRL